MAGMPQRGRPRLTIAIYQGRLEVYCRRYGAVCGPDGLPPFPTGKRETAQHREWLALYKTRDRLARRGQGRCERCLEPVADGGVLCEAHRQGRPRPPGGACPVCLEPAPDAALHPRCRRLAALAADLGPKALERLRQYLWPDAEGPSNGRRAQGRKA